MNDYIKREDALSAFRRVYMIPGQGTAKEIYAKQIENTYKQIESVPCADVVEVVRCKDCKWCHSGYCEMYDDLIPFGCANRPWEEWFCADGTRMDGDS